MMRCTRVEVSVALSCNRSSHWSASSAAGVDMGDLAEAEEYITLAVQIAEQIGHPYLEQWRDGLARVRAMRQG